MASKGLQQIFSEIHLINSWGAESRLKLQLVLALTEYLKDNLLYPSELKI